MYFCFDIDGVSESPAGKRPGFKPGKQKIYHVINPFSAAADSDMNIVQDITMRSMQTAAAMAPDDCIQLAAVVSNEDRGIVPNGFEIVAELDRSIQSLKQFAQKSELVAAQKKVAENLEIEELGGSAARFKVLPFLGDILTPAARLANDDDYVIYTNSDIAVQPYFYDAVIAIINRGYDAIIVNRRTIAEDFLKNPDLSLMYAEHGKIHPGFDCFVIKAEALKRFIYENVIIGADLVGRALLYNIEAFSKNSIALTNSHLTFHIGDDQEWKNDPYGYSSHNHENVESVVNHLLVDKYADKDALLTFLALIDNRISQPSVRRFQAVYRRNPDKLSSLPRVQIKKFVKSKDEEAITAPALRKWWEKARKKDNADICKDVSELSHAFSEDSEGLAFLGFKAMYAGNNDLALDCFFQSVLLSPEFSAGRIGLGLLFEEMGLMERALEYLKDVDLLKSQAYDLTQEKWLIKRLTKVLNRTHMTTALVDLAMQEFFEHPKDKAVQDRLVELLMDDNAEFEAEAVKESFEFLKEARKKVLSAILDGFDNYTADKWKFNSGFSRSENVNGLPVRWLGSQGQILLPVTEDRDFVVTLYGVAAASREAMSSLTAKINNDPVLMEVKPWGQNGFTVNLKAKKVGEELPTTAVLNLQCSDGVVTKNDMKLSLMLHKLDMSYV